MNTIKQSDIILGSGVSFSKSPEIAENVIAVAIKCGIHKFDTAPSYKTESLVGDILKRQCEQGVFSRKKLYIQTKIDAWQMQDGRISFHLDEALKKLGTEYLDALLIHWPIPEYMESTWKKMQKMKDAGVIKKVGICNVRVRQLKEYIDWCPDIIQIERHPLNTFENEVDFCHKHGVEVQAYSPLCKMDDRIKNSDVVKKIAGKYGKDQGQIVLRWHLDTGVIPIFTTTKTSRVVLYSELDDFSLTDEEVKAISGLNENYKMYLESMSCPGF